MNFYNIFFGPRSQEWTKDIGRDFCAFRYIAIPSTKNSDISCFIYVLTLIYFIF